MYFCYVLQSIPKQNYFYKGFCKNLEVRLKEHNSRKTKSNKAYLPLKIVYYETFNNLKDAAKTEKYWKTAAGRRYL